MCVTVVIIIFIVRTCSVCVSPQHVSDLWFPPTTIADSVLHRLARLCLCQLCLLHCARSGGISHHPRRDARYEQKKKCLPLRLKDMYIIMCICMCLFQEVSCAYLCSTIHIDILYTVEPTLKSWFICFFTGDLLNNYCKIDPVANATRFFFACVVMLTYPIECFVAREVCTCMIILSLML